MNVVIEDRIEMTDKDLIEGIKYCCKELFIHEPSDEELNSMTKEELEREYEWYSEILCK